MNQMIKEFTDERFGTIRATVIEEEPWFVGKDVAGALGYSNTQKAIRDHVDEEDKLTERIVLSGQNREVIVINESGLYSLILSSKLPTAKKFKHWVTSDVLPSIRKTGSYQKELTGEELMAKALLEAKSVLSNLKIRNSELTVENQIMKPKSDYFDELVDRNLLTNFCLENRYLYRAQKKGTLMPYQKHVQEGLFELKECFNEKSTWKGLQTMVTPKGRETFRLILGKGE